MTTDAQMPRGGIRIVRIVLFPVVVALMTTCDDGIKYLRPVLSNEV
jgi:hypothetical protein